MRTRPAFLQFDWSKAGLSMDLPVFVYSHTKTSFKFLSRQGRYVGKLSMWLKIFYFKQRRENLTGLLFCLDLVCQGLLIIEIVICIHYPIGSSPHAVRPTTTSFHFCMSVNMYVFDVKSYKECHKDKKGIKKVVTGLVCVPVSLIGCKCTC